MKIDYNPEGKWSEGAVKRRYARLQTQLGCASGFELRPRTYTNSRGMTWVYNIMDSVVDGVQLGDPACIELSVEYIEDNAMGSYTGYIRERMARSLRHAPLAKSQSTRLTNVFLAQLAQGNLLKEFKEYIRLFRAIGIEPHTSTIAKYAASEKAYVRRAAQRLLA